MAAVLINIFFGIPQAMGQSELPKSAMDLQDNIEDLANVDFRTDIRIFVVMAALNAAGYNFEAEEQDMSEVRTLVKKRLSELPSGTFTELQLQYQTTTLWAPETTHAAYTSLALLLEGPPGFDYREQLVNVPHGIDVIRGFEQLLPDFYENAGLEMIWRDVQPRYQEELQLYRPVVNRVIRETLQYFRIPAKIYFDRNIVIIPDLLAYHDIVNARNVEDVYYIVVGPSRNPEGNYIKLQHEYLHFLLDSLIEEQAENIKKSESLLKISQKQPLFQQDLWNDYSLLITESLIESLLHRIHPVENETDADRDLRKLRLIQRGMILCPYFERRLSEFESPEGEQLTLPGFLEKILTEIPEADIKKDLDHAELMAKRQMPMYMRDWEKKLGEFLEFNEREVLNNPGKVSREVADALAIREYVKFDERRRMITSDFDELHDEVKKLKNYD